MVFYGEKGVICLIVLFNVWVFGEVWVELYMVGYIGGGIVFI